MHDTDSRGQAFFTQKSETLTPPGHPAPCQGRDWGGPEVQARGARRTSCACLPGLLNLQDMKPEDGDTESSPWIASDTWYVVGSSSEPAAVAFLNARTGVLQTHEPDGLLEDGRRRLSAATSGPWAVPFALASEPPQRLPQAMRPQLSKADIVHNLAASSSLAPDFEVWGRGDGPMFTAPHGVNLLRDSKPEHLPEDFTTFLARTWALHTSGASLVWPAASLAWVTKHEKPLPGARDPNYLTVAECDTHAWWLSLQRRPPEERWLHVDVHGKRDDRPGECDCDVGVGAVREVVGDAAADALAVAVHAALETALQPSGFTVDRNPRLQGAWRSVPRRTLTQSAVRLGYASCVQLELGYRLRRALSRDRVLCLKVGAALAASVVVPHRVWHCAKRARLE